MPTRCAANRGIPAAAGANWSVVFTGKLAAGTDTRALAHGLGLPLGGYLPRLKPLERARRGGPADGRAGPHRPAAQDRLPGRTGAGGPGPGGMNAPERRTGRRRWEQVPENGQAATSPEVLEQVRLRALGRDGGLSEVDLASAVQATGNVIGSHTTTEMVQNLSRDIHGLGMLEEFARQPGVTDVLVDGQGRIWVDGADGLKPSGSGFADPAALRALAVRFAAAAGRRLDDAQPFVDLTLGNYRVHAVLPPISTGGTLISVRVKRTVRPELAGLIDPARPDWLQALRAIVTARLNFLVSGGTGAGKTTLLAAMLAGVPANERIIVVEDSAELTPSHPHLIGLQARGGNVEGAGEIGLNMLVRQSLRMRPGPAGGRRMQGSGDR